MSEITESDFYKYSRVQGSFAISQFTCCSLCFCFFWFFCAIFHTLFYVLILTAHCVLHQYLCWLLIWRLIDLPKFSIVIRSFSFFHPGLNYPLRFELWEFIEKSMTSSLIYWKCSRLTLKMGKQLRIFLVCYEQIHNSRDVFLYSWS